jgi:hypothetical protein
MPAAKPLGNVTVARRRERKIARVVGVAKPLVTGTFVVGGVGQTW